MMLRNNFRRLIRTTTGYSLNTLIGPLFTIVLTPLYARTLRSDGYGEVDTLLMLGQIISIFGALGMTSALTAYYFDSDDPHQRERTVASAVWIALGWSSLLALLVFVAAEPITALSIRRPDLANVTRLMALGLPFGVLYGLQTAVLRLKTAVWRANLLALSYIVVFALSNVVFVVLLRWRALGVISAYLATHIVTSLLALAFAPDALRQRPVWAYSNRLIAMGIKLVPAALATWLLVYIDRPILLYYGVDMAAIGVYAIGVKLASMLGVLLLAFQSAWLPFALEIKDQPSAPRTYSKILLYYTVGGLGLALGLSLFAHEVFLLFTTAEFLPAEQYIWLLALVPLISGFSAVVTIGLYLEKRLGQLSWIIGASAAINIGLNVVLIPRYGVWGAVVATAVGYAASPVLAAIVAQRYRPLPFEWSKVARVVSVYLALAGLGVILGSRFAWPSLLLRTGILLAYLPMLVLLGTFERWELQLVRRAIRTPQQFLRWVTHH